MGEQRRRILFEEDDVVVVTPPPEHDPEVREMLVDIAFDGAVRRSVREELKLSREDVAEAIGVARSTVEAWEASPDIKGRNLGRLARLYVAIRRNPGLLNRPSDVPLRRRSDQVFRELLLCQVA